MSFEWVPVMGMNCARAGAANDASSSSAAPAPASSRLAGLRAAAPARELVRAAMV